MSTPAEASWMRWLRYAGLASIGLVIISAVLLRSVDYLGSVLIAVAVVIWVVYLVADIRLRRQRDRGRH